MANGGIDQSRHDSIAQARLRDKAVPFTSGGPRTHRSDYAAFAQRINLLC